MANMGLGPALGDIDTCFTRKFRWLLTIPGVTNDGLSTLPPQKSARPNLAFKEMQIEHLNETIYYPSKPDFKPIQVTIYDFKTSNIVNHPVYKWIKSCYDAHQGKWSLPADNGLLKRVELEMLDGCGNTVEIWVYEQAWPMQVDFGDLDMANSEYMTCEVTLRYARAYIVEG